MLSFKIKLIALLLVFGLLLVGGTVMINHSMLKSSLVEYVDQRDQQRLERIKHNITFVLEEKLEDDIHFIDELTWRKIASISSRVDFSETFVPVDMFLDYPFSDFKQRHPDFIEKRISLMDSQQRCMFGEPIDRNTLMLPIIANQQIVGYLGYRHRSELTEELDIQLAERQHLLLTFGMLIVVLLSSLLLIPFARYFLTPILAVNQGMRSLTSGDFTKRLEVNRRDELGQLQQDFNHLATSLQKGKQSRNQWIADISHELRTPLTILRGDIEALKDGVRQITPSTLDNLHSEVMHLNRLVEDLYQIALNDVGGLQYQMVTLDFGVLVNQTVQSFIDQAETKGLRFESDVPKQPINLRGDGDRLQQMLNNLFSNSLAYTDAPGLVRLQMTHTNSHLTLCLEDSPPGVSVESLSCLFDRFYRGETSRNRRFGGAGIGLALVEQIVQAHQGTISVDHSTLGGIKITIILPLEAFAR